MWFAFKDYAAGGRVVEVELGVFALGGVLANGAGDGVVEYGAFDSAFANFDGFGFGGGVV